MGACFYLLFRSASESLAALFFVCRVRKCLLITLQPCNCLSENVILLRPFTRYFTAADNIVKSSCAYGSPINTLTPPLDGEYVLSSGENTWVRIIRLALLLAAAVPASLSLSLSLTYSYSTHSSTHSLTHSLTHSA